MSSLRQTYRKIAPGPITPILRPMTLDGLAMGDGDQAVDGSITPVRFYVQPPDNDDWRISAFTMAVSGTGAEVQVQRFD